MERNKDTNWLIRYMGYGESISSMLKWMAVAFVVSIASLCLVILLEN